MVNVLIGVAAFFLWYLSGRYIKPLGELYTFPFVLLSKFTAPAEKSLEEYQAKGKLAKHETKYPGLRTTILMIMLTLALLALVADVVGTIQAMISLWGKEFIVPSLPPIANYSVAVLMICVGALFGAIWIETKGVIPEEARIFVTSPQYEKKFNRFVLISFMLTLITSILYYMLKPFFLINPDSNIVHLLQVVIFLLMGALILLLGVIVITILAFGFHAIFSVVITFAWFLAHVSTNICEYIQVLFTKQGNKNVLLVRADDPQALPSAEIAALPSPEEIPVPVDTAYQDHEEAQALSQKQTKAASPAVLGNVPIEEPVFMEYCGNTTQNDYDTDADQSKKK